MTRTSDITRIVMRRVRAIRMMRLSLAPASAGLVSLLALWGIGREVWVAKVIENVQAVESADASARYVASAFLHTDLVVQLLSILVVASVFWLASELAHLLRPTHRLA